MTKEHLQDLRETWAQRVDAYRSSGLSGAAWCAANQVKEHQLWYWASRFRKESSDSSAVTGFLPVQVQEPFPASIAPLLVRVGSVAIEVSPGYNEQLLRQLVQLLSDIC